MRPLLFGYLNAWPSTSADGRAAFRRALTAFAMTEGFTLADIFAERTGGRSAAFDALIHALQRDGARVVAVPALDHWPVCLESRSRKSVSRARACRWW